MESKGVIRKYNSKDDSRKTVVVLTDKGKMVAEEFKETMISIMIMMVEDVGFDEIQNFIRISKKIKRTFEEKCFFADKSNNVDKY